MVMKNTVTPSTICGHCRDQAKMSPVLPTTAVNVNIGKKANDV